MNWLNILWIFYFAAHTVAGILNILLELALYEVEHSGLMAWVFPGGCLALLGMDLTGRISLRGSTAKTVAALLLPLLCGFGEVLLWDGAVRSHVTPAVRAWVFAPLLLAVYVLLRGEKTDLPQSKARVLLEQGSALGVVETVWLVAAAGAVLFMSTIGLLFSAIIGGLMAGRNGLLDYCGVKGILVGLLVLYLLQCLWFCRGALLARGDDLEQDDGPPLLTLFVPVWNQVQVRKLVRRLQLRGVKDYY